MKLASRTTHIIPSPTLKINATAKSMAAACIDIIDFSSGELANGTPDFVNEAAHEAIQLGFTKYTPVSGIEELKNAIIEKFQQDQGVLYEKSQILVSCGAKHILYNVAQAILDPGDEVIIPAPYWVSYPDIVRLADGNPVILETRESEGYAIDPEALQASITPRTKALILNSPCNPTGVIYSKATLRNIAEIAKRHDLLLISDEIYEKLVFGDPPFLSIATADPEIIDQTIVVNGVSKAFAMTGWRIGYAGGPKKLIAAMSNIQSQSTSNPSSISQKAAVAALQGGSSFFENIVNELQLKKKLVVEKLNKISGITCQTPAGAFYVFPNVSGLLGKKHSKGIISTPSDLANYLLNEAHIACVPGEPFGSQFHLRISFTSSMEEIKRGIDRFEAAIQSLN